MLQRIRRLLIANRGEIAIRVMRAANELDIETVAIYSQEDRFGLHRTKADEAYLVGEGKGAIEAYLGDIADILRMAREGVERDSPRATASWRRILNSRRAVLGCGRACRGTEPCDHARARQQGGGAQSCGFGRRGGDAGNAGVAGRPMSWPRRRSATR